MFSRLFACIDFLKKQYQWTPAANPLPETTSYPPPSVTNDGNESIYKGAMSVTDGNKLSLLNIKLLKEFILERPLPSDNLSVDSNLARYLDRVYWEKKLTAVSLNIVCTCLSNVITVLEFDSKCSSTK